MSEASQLVTTSVRVQTRIRATTNSPARRRLERISKIEGPFFSIDVECVATGRGGERAKRAVEPTTKTSKQACEPLRTNPLSHSAHHRSVGRVVMVDGDEKKVFDSFVKVPSDKKLFSCLTKLTGLVESDIEDAEELDVVIEKLKGVLDKDGVLVGQGIGHDVSWCKLEAGVDFRER